MGSLGFGGTVVVVGATAWPGTVDGCVVDFVRGLPACGPEMTSPAVPPGWSFSRPVADTMRDSCRARLSAAMGRVMSRLMVRRVPTGDTCALCWSVGANSTNHTAKARAPSRSTRVQRSRTRPSRGTPSSAVTQDVAGSLPDAATGGAGAGGAAAPPAGTSPSMSMSMSIRSGSR